MCTHFSASDTVGEAGNKHTHTHSIAEYQDIYPEHQQYFSALPPSPQPTYQLTHSVRGTMGFWSLIKCYFTNTINTHTYNSIASYPGSSKIVV